MTWMTLEEFKKNFAKCSVCEKKARYIGEGYPTQYCDDHYSIVRERKWITKDESKKIWPDK